MPESPAEKGVKRSTTYKVLIKSGDEFFHLGTIVIRTFTGDILYTPSTRFHDDLTLSRKREIEHFSWHAGGQVHIKYKGDVDGEYLIVEKSEERQKISEIGFQDFLKDTVLDFKLLPKYQKKVTDLDVVFDAACYSGPVCFCFSMVSGKLVAAKYYGYDVPIKTVTPKEESWGIGATIRALGYHSGSADVMLQYALVKSHVGPQRANRAILIPKDMKISKLGIDLNPALLAEKG